MIDVSFEYFWQLWKLYVFFYQPWGKKTFPINKACFFLFFQSCHLTSKGRGRGTKFCIWHTGYSKLREKNLSSFQLVKSLMSSKLSIFLFWIFYFFICIYWKYSDSGKLGAWAGNFHFTLSCVHSLSAWSLIYYFSTM